jgi:putative intracellular protease/amidase
MTDAPDLNSRLHPLLLASIGPDHKGGDRMSKKIVLTGKAVVSFRKVIEDASDYDAAELMADDDLRGAQIVEDDLLDIEWIHDDVEIEVTP